MTTMRLMMVRQVVETAGKEVPDRYEVMVECSTAEMLTFVSRAAGIDVTAAPDEKPRSRAKKEATNGTTKPAEGDGNAAWGIDPAQPAVVAAGSGTLTTAAPKPAVAPVAAAPKAATVAASDIPVELTGAKVLSEIVRYFIAQGVTSQAEVASECAAWKEKGGDLIPVLARIENLPDRIARGAAALGLT